MIAPERDVYDLQYEVLKKYPIEERTAIFSYQTVHELIEDGALLGGWVERFIIPDCFESGMDYAVHALRLGQVVLIQTLAGPLEVWEPVGFRVEEGVS